MQHISHTHAIRLNAPPDVILPLFTAVGEREWVEGWNPEYVYPETGEPAVGMIWKTAQHNAQDAIWVTVDYDTEQHTASYVKYTPERNITRVDVRCYAFGESQTTAEVTYTLTALTPDGQADILKLTKEHYVHWIDSWERALNHYLEFGEMLPHA